MQFNSLEYGLFFPLALLLYYAAPAPHRWAVLVATGGAVLAWKGIAHLAIAVGLTVVNYAIGLAIEKHAEAPRASWLLGLALCCNLFVLGLFKYATVLGAGVHDVLAAIGVPAASGEWSFFLPLGISYYVFQLISYDLEVYWGRAPATRHLGHLAASVLFFPKLVAGPIERPHHFLPQLVTPRPFAAENVTAGLAQIAWGVFKKCVIADRIALIVDPVYENVHGFGQLTLLLTIGLYVVQTYNDFSGYTDIALGSARTLGLEIVPNFNHPFSARSVTDFWRRWHMSLSSWTADYIFRPLSTYVSFNTSWRKTGMAASITASFLVLGIWHGATWNFVLFGLAHGLAVSIETLTQRHRTRLLARLPERLADRLNNVVTVVFYACSCVLFRAASLGDAGYVLGHAFTSIGGITGADRALFREQRYHVLLLGLMAVLFAAAHRLSLHRPLSAWVGARPLWVRWSAYYALIAAIVIFGVFGVKEFVYVQF